MCIAKIISNAGFLALALLGAAFASPLPLSLTGNALNVNVERQDYSMDGGGAFIARVANNSHFTNSALTTFWCVDNENNVGLPDTYLANITPLGNWTGGANSSVRKGTYVLASDWNDHASLTPLQRYQAAAWLITQTTYFKGSARNNGEDILIQHAIWSLTDLAGVSPDNPHDWQNPYYTAATTHITTTGANFGKGSWAVVSGVVDADGHITSNTRQTFLVQVVPEPGTYALMGAGLIILACLRRRRTS